MSTLKTGDILLFAPTMGERRGLWRLLDLVDWCISTATASPYTHAALVLKDPTFIHPSLRGLFIWESGYEGTPDPQDGRVKLGVQITPLHQCAESFGGQIFVRRLVRGGDKFTEAALRRAHIAVYNKPYDLVPEDWVEALFGKDSQPQKTDRFWCSALVAYILVEVGLVDATVDWSVISPANLSSRDSALLLSRFYADDMFLCR